MMTNEQILFAKERVQSVTGITLPWPVEVEQQDGRQLTVTLGRDGAKIAAGAVNDLTRGFFLLSRAVKENWPEGEITQYRRFSSVGVMVDCSRNAVMTVEAVKRYIDQLA